MEIHVIMKYLSILNTIKWLIKFMCVCVRVGASESVREFLEDIIQGL